MIRSVPLRPPTSSCMYSAVDEVRGGVLVRNGYWGKASCEAETDFPQTCKDRWQDAKESVAKDKEFALWMIDSMMSDKTRFANISTQNHCMIGGVLPETRNSSRLPTQITVRVIWPYHPCLHFFRICRRMNGLNRSINCIHSFSVKWSQFQRIYCIFCDLCAFSVNYIK